MKCVLCDHEMVDSVTTFTVVRNRIVYVTENVPCLECPICGHITFSQDVAKRLEKYCSGEIVANDIYKAFVFRWNIPVIELKPSSTKVQYAPTLSTPGTVQIPVPSVI